MKCQGLFGRTFYRSAMMLPLLAGLALSGCSDSDSGTPVDSGITMEFAEVATPVTDAEKRQILASQSVTIDGTSYNIGFNTLLRSGATFGDETFGLIRNYMGAPVLQEDGSEFISNSTDFTSLLHLGDKIYSVTHFESQPGGMYLSELEQDENGLLTAVSTRSIDFSKWGGLWTPCAGSVTPWNTHLGSEEYEPDARSYELATTKDEIGSYFGSMSNYFDVPFYDDGVTAEDIKEVVNPYAYGYPTEVIVQQDGSHSIIKHYALARVAVELAYVMPDKRTVYISDDGTNVGLFMFVADTAGDLTAGTLYAAQLDQTSDENGGSFNLNWIDLGHATFDEIKQAIDSKVVFSDIFDAVDPNEDNTCPTGYTSINTTWGHECLAVRAGMETVASRLEARRYAAIKGATTELRKEEGITFDSGSMTLFVAMSEVAKGMEDNSSSDVGGPNHVRLPANKCGTVYKLDVATNSAIGSDYVAQNMVGLVSGIPTTYPEDSLYANNTCDVNGIANPDNITFITGQDTLIIGEDTGSGHQNDLIWAYDISATALTRIQTTPYGSETTSPYIYPSLNGFGYLMSVVQHPYGESDQDQLIDSTDAAAYVGYIGPFPALGEEGPDSVDNTFGRQGMSSVNFLDVPVPTTDSEKRQVWGTPSVSVNGSGAAIGFNTILRSGDMLGGNTFGLLLDSDGNAITEEDGSVSISNSNDFSSLLDVYGSLFMVSQFESRPAAMYVSELSQDENGFLAAISTRPIDFSAVRGGWVHCAGSVTPWTTHLGSEEYEPNARFHNAATGIITESDGVTEDTYYSAMGAYYGGDLTQLNPYDYGYPVEVAITDASGSTSVAKHYAMGRMALELAYVLPDQKTVYMSDDGTNVGLFMFIADTAGDLSAGSLYAAKFTQTSAVNGGSFNLSWISLGHATDSEIDAMLTGEDKLTFDDIFSVENPAADGTCSVGFIPVNAGHESPYLECLQLKAGMDVAASRLETRRYAGYLGATTELRKEEGITFNPASKTLYIGMSEVSNGMEDNHATYDLNGNNDIRLPKNKCGTVYALALGTDGTIGSDYVALTMNGLVSGIPTTYPEDSVYAGNTCNINGIANPDNVTFMPGYNTLIIGEDTGSGHQNDLIWSYNLAAGELTRIQTTPYGSETTSPYFYPNVGGNGYLMSVIQHPYGESDQDQLSDSSEAAAYTGYVGPFPNMEE
nr:alkaline phosphatase PhoX [uncultured Desulfuromonas sp.]